MSFIQRRLSFVFNLGGASQGPITGLRASCVITNAGAPSQGQLEAAIFGLPLSLMNTLSTIGTQTGLIGKNYVAVQASTENGSMATAFTGTITNAYVDGKSQPNVCFRISATAGQYEDIVSTKPISVQGSGDPAQIAQQITQAMGFQFENNGVSGTKLRNPYYSGTSVSQLRRLGADANIGWTIENNTVAIWPNGQPRNGDAVLISPDTGMIGYPAFSGSGVTVSTLYNSALRQNGEVNIQSSLTPACGSWSIIRIAHELESEMPNGKWFSHFDTSRIGSQDTPFGAPEQSDSDGSDASDDTPDNGGDSGSGTSSDSSSSSGTSAESPGSVQGVAPTYNSDLADAEAQRTQDAAQNQDEYGVGGGPLGLE